MREGHRMPYEIDCSVPGGAAQTTSECLSARSKRRSRQATLCGALKASVGNSGKARKNRSGEVPEAERATPVNC